MGFTLLYCIDEHCVTGTHVVLARRYSTSTAQYDSGQMIQSPVLLRHPIGLVSN